MGTTPEVLKSSSFSERTQQLFREAKWIVLALLGLALLSMLVSFDPRDPSFFHAGSDVKEVHNWVGSLGAWVSATLLYVFGLSAYWWVLLCGWAIFRGMRRTLRMSLFTAQERAAFRQLIKISGVGARTALSILSGLSVADLAQAVTLQESGRLIKVPGIGKKTAERLLLELKGKLGADMPLAAGTSVQSDAQLDILQALVALGYSEKEAGLALKALPTTVGVSEGIKLALKALAK